MPASSLSRRSLAGQTGSHPEIDSFTLKHTEKWALLQPALAKLLPCTVWRRCKEQSNTPELLPERWLGLRLS